LLQNGGNEVYLSPAVEVARAVDTQISVAVVEEQQNVRDARL